MTAPGNFIFICPACGYKARVPGQFAGCSIKCPGCQTPQVAVAPLNNEHKSASFVRVAATPMPFSMPQEQIDALSGAPVPVSDGKPPTTTKSFPSPLPGAIRVTTDRVTKQTATVPPEAAPLANAVRGGTVDFTCTACNARLRLPGQYAGKSILCPKCSQPQKVLLTSLTVPMDTTRSIAAAATPLPGTSTGMRVRVTPLPAAYPTPLPTAMTVPTTAVQGALKPLATPPPAVAPAVAETAADGDLVGDIDAIVAEAAPATEAPPKPHPSRGPNHTRSIKRPPAVEADPATAASASLAIRARSRGPSTIKFIAVSGGLLVLAIALAAGLTYYALALRETRQRLVEAQRATAAEAEATAARERAAKARIAELEAALLAAQALAQTLAHATGGEPAAPVTAAPGEPLATTPAPVVPAEAAPMEAALPAPAPAPAGQPPK